MHRKQIYLFYFLACIVVYNVLHGQTISIGVGTGHTMIQGNNFYTDDFGRIGLYTRKNGTQTNFAGLGLKNGIEFSVNTKTSFPNIPAIIIAQIHYIPMRGEQKVEMWDLMATQSHYEDVTSMNDIWSYRLGVRYDFQINNFYPFGSASFLLNNWNDSKLQFDYQERLLMRTQYKNGIRYGYNMSIGLGYRIGNQFDMEIEGGYNFMNEYNGRDGEAKMNTINISFTTYYVLIQ